MSDTTTNSDTGTDPDTDAETGTNADTGTTPAPGAGSDEAAADRKVRKVREGVVVSAAMDKTAVVAVIDRVRHARYNKFVQRTKKLYAHDETNDVNEGDRVRVMETRPLSKSKHWRVVEVLERAK